MKQYDVDELKRLAKAVGWELNRRAECPDVYHGWYLCEYRLIDGPKSHHYFHELPPIACRLAAELRRLAEEYNSIRGVAEKVRPWVYDGQFVQTTSLDVLNIEASSLEAWAKEQDEPKVEQHGRVVRTDNNLRCMECGQPVKMWVCPTCQQSVRKE